MIANKYQINLQSAFFQLSSLLDGYRNRAQSPSFTTLLAVSEDFDRFCCLHHVSVQTNTIFWIFWVILVIWAGVFSLYVRKYWPFYIKTNFFGPQNLFIHWKLDIYVNLKPPPRWQVRERGRKWIASMLPQQLRRNHSCLILFMTSLFTKPFPRSKRTTLGWQY